MDIGKLKNNTVFYEGFEDEQCQKACYEVGDYAVVAAQIHRTALELGLEASEHVFYFPALCVGAYYFYGSFFFKIGAYRIESVKAGLFLYCFNIKCVSGVVSDFGVVGVVCLDDEP